MALESSNDYGLFSNTLLGRQWFPSNETSLQRGWQECWEALQKTYFKKVKSPYAVYFGVNSIDWLSTATMRQREVNVCNKKGLKIYLWEPLSTYDTRKPTHNLYVNWSADELEFIRAKELDSIHEYVVRNNLTNVDVYCPSYKCKIYFQEFYPKIKLNCTPVGWIYPATINVREEEGTYDADLITKKFWCGNWRYASHRHCIASYLVDKTDSYNISWLYESNKDILLENAYADSLPCEKTLLLGAEKLDTMSPITMDKPISKKLKLTEYIDIHIDTNPKQSYQECFCAIVNETRYAEPTGLLTEKIMNAMLNYRPVIMVGPPGNLEYMQAWGFQTFSDWFDESYDLEQDHSKRMEKIFDLIDWINAKSIEELKEMYIDMLPTLLHNKIWIEELQELLLDAPITKNKIYKRIRS